MSGVVEVGLLNTVCALAIAAVALWLGRRRVRPEWVYLVWFVALLKLVAPPLVRVPALPALDGWLSETAVIATDVPHNESIATQPVAFGPVVPMPGPARGVAITPVFIFGGVWIAGSLALATLTWIRVRRFRRLIDAARPASRELQTRFAALAAEAGVRNVPGLRVVQGPVPPLLWGLPRRYRVVVPEELVASLAADELDALLLHELIHVRRGDPFMRWLECAIVTVAWWNPVAWWTRRNLRVAEEQCCDARLLDLRPTLARSYASALVKTLELLAGRRAPALATGAAETRRLKERLTMILSPDRPRRPLMPAVALLGVGAVLALAVLPGFVLAESQDENAGTHDADWIALQRQALDLDHQMADLEEQRARLKREIAYQEAEERAAAARIRAESLRAEGRNAEADAIEQKVERHRQAVESEMAIASRNEDLRRDLRESGWQLRGLRLDLERAENDGDEQYAADIEANIEQLEREIATRTLDYEQWQGQHSSHGDLHSAADLHERLYKNLLERFHGLHDLHRGREAATADEAEALARERAGLEAELAEAGREHARFENDAQAEAAKLALYKAQLAQVARDRARFESDAEAEAYERAVLVAELAEAAAHDRARFEDDAEAAAGKLALYRAQLAQVARVAQVAQERAQFDDDAQVEARERAMLKAELAEAAAHDRARLTDDAEAEAGKLALYKAQLAQERAQFDDDAQVEASERAMFEAELAEAAARDRRNFEREQLEMQYLELKVHLEAVESALAVAEGDEAARLRAEVTKLRAALKRIAMEIGAR